MIALETARNVNDQFEPLLRGVGQGWSLIADTFPFVLSSVFRAR